jgi:hypothetical protein
MAKAGGTTSTDRMPLREARALMVGTYGSPKLAESLLLDELFAGQMPWGSLLQKGEASDDFWKSQPRVNFEENSASNKPKVRMFYLDDPPQPPRGCEHFGIWLSRPHVLALLPEVPSENEKVGPQMRRVLQTLKKLYPPDGKVPDDVSTEVVRGRVNTELAADTRMQELAAPSWDTVNRALGRG